MTKKWYKFLLLLIVFFAFTASESHAQKSAIPNIVLSDLNGKKINLKDITKEKITIISFWATWCAPCKKELDNIAPVYKEWQEKYNVQLLAINVDDARTATRVKPMVNSKQWNYNIILDSNEELKRALKVSNVPFTFLVNQKGEIVYEHSGYKEGDELKLLEKIKALK